MQADLSSELSELQKIKEDDECDPLNDVFDILEVGCNGGIEVSARSILNRCQHKKFSEQLSKLPNGLPSIFPSGDELDLEEYLIHPEKLPIHDFYESQKFWPRTQKPVSLFNTTFSPVLTDLKVKRDPKTGKLLGYHEVAVSNAECTGKNSTSLLRQPEPQTADIRGDSTNIPFKPGGLDEPDTANKVNLQDFSANLDFENDLLDVPPGFTQRISFQSQDVTDSVPAPNIISMADILSGKLDLGDDFDQYNETVMDKQNGKETSNEGDQVLKIQFPAELKKSESLENLLPKNENIFHKKIEKIDSVDGVVDKDWAIVVTDPVDDFHSRVPDMARKYPFELDTFQKQAVIHLENKECVFVAAHTSAGKTVVAEYAIALSEKHFAKTIYTSPIKALSNQKFREFKKGFESVGLITGDIQINPEANCLVMTTEILRSMLYRGSRLIRDTEWVIFDEVHYVNDNERGVVWEEVLIMLPDTVGIIMLSATVPNTKEFAGWVGRIKKKNIYVISTLKRPVPLEYFLYTGHSAKTANEMFPIVDKRGKFLPAGHKKAVDAKNERSNTKDKHKDSYGPKGTRHNTNPKEDRNIWITLIRKLEKDDKLPVVAFTFSRNRCNENARKLSSLDLTTTQQKHRIRIFIQKSISLLKDQDKQLPQVKEMQELLERGLAVHHSGILPILKEVVEMLFQENLVKVLFATETFAMGVNMPARTVVFDSIRKHDGTKFRELLPGEFIQMAGRAGRRGLDDTGTVIILCKADVPEILDFEKMMMGKPTLLESRFRLTYSMILNLLRSDNLRVEDMMKRSFAEFHLLKKAPERERMIAKFTEDRKQLEKLTCEKCLPDVQNYYDMCKELMTLSKSLQLTLVTSPSGQKSLSTGRLIIIRNKQLSTRYGMILSKKLLFSARDLQQGKKSYTILLACDQNEVYTWDEGQVLNVEDDVIVEPYTDIMDVYCPTRPCAHTIVDVREEDIVVITDHVKKNLNSEAMINDFNKRKQPRFRNDPPGKSISFATEELLRLCEKYPLGLPMTDLSTKDLTIHEQRTRQKFLQSEIQRCRCVMCPNFDNHFKIYRRDKMLEDNIGSLKEKSSIEMLTLIPEYKNRKKVLIDLGYLNKDEVVGMKGRVACEISNHEVLISRLLYENFFNNFEPEEVVALLSCFVFEQNRLLVNSMLKLARFILETDDPSGRTWAKKRYSSDHPSRRAIYMKRCREPELTDRLKKGKERILGFAREIATVEKKWGMDTSCVEFVEQFKFGLVQVVHEWAKGMPFNEITDLTDVQEGIIVRCIQRLNDLCCDVKNASRCLGVKDMESKMDEASNLLKRDIVFAASLYTRE